jgi:hypothetical protein
VVDDLVLICWFCIPIGYYIIVIDGARVGNIGCCIGGGIPIIYGMFCGCCYIIMRYYKTIG